MKKVWRLILLIRKKKKKITWGSYPYTEQFTLGGVTDKLFAVFRYSGYTAIPFIAA